MHARLSALVATAGIAVAVLPAHAASPSLTPAPRPQITDPSGDANGLNEPVTEPDPTPPTTPASIALVG